MKTILSPPNPNLQISFLSPWWLKVIFFLIIVMISNIKVSAQIKQWEASFFGGGNNDDWNEHDQLNKMLATPDGGYLLGGSSAFYRDENKDGHNFRLIKIDSIGKKQWEKNYGGLAPDNLNTMVAAPDGGYLLGGTSQSGVSSDKTEASRDKSNHDQEKGDYWIIKIDTNGNKLWDKTYGGTSADDLQTLIITPDGGYLLGGTSKSPAGADKTEASRDTSNLPYYRNDYWVVKINANGAKVWDKTFGGNALDELSSLAVTPEGGYILAGTSGSGISGEKSQPNKDNSQSVFLNQDYWVIKISNSGSKVWDKTYGGSGRDFLRKIITANDGGYILAGSSYSGTSEDKTEAVTGFWLLNINGNGVRQWDKTVDKTGNLADMLLTPDGGYLLGGGSSKYVVVKLDASLTKVWEKAYGGKTYREVGTIQGRDKLSSLLLTPDGGYLLGGSSNSDRDDGEVYGSYYYYYWIVKIKETSKKSQTITFNTIPTQIFNGKPVILSATASSGLPVNYTVVSGPATVSDNILTITGIGTVTVSASQAGNDTYLPAEVVEQSFNVDKATPVIKEWDASFGGYVTSVEDESISDYVPDENDWETEEWYVGSSYIQDMVASPDGGYLLGGYSNSEKGKDKSEGTLGNFWELDYWLVKIDAQGKKVWDKTLSGSIKTVVAIPGGGYLLGGTLSVNSGTGISYGYQVIKIDNNGNRLWSKSFGNNSFSTTNYPKLEALVATPEGGYLLSGLIYENKNGDLYQQGSWLVKIDESSTKLWDKTLSESFPFTAVTADGNFLLANVTHLVNINKDGTQLWQKAILLDFTLQELISTPDGGYLLGGLYNNPQGERRYDYKLLKLDPTGTKIWENAYGGNGYEGLSISFPSIALLATPDGGYLLGGTSPSDISGDKTEDNRNGSRDFWVVKISSGGNVIWDKTFGGFAYDAITDLLPTLDGGFLLGGFSESSNTGDKSVIRKSISDYWVVKIKEEGTPPPVSTTWNLRYGSSGIDRFTVVIKTSDGGYLSGGYSNSEISGDKSQASRGGADFWIVKTDVNGVKQWDQRFGGSSHDYLNRIIQTKDGGYLLAGSSTSGKGGDKSEGRRGDQDYWIVKTSSTGVKEWDKTYGGSGFDDLRKINQLYNGDYLLAGTSDSPLSGEKSQTSQGGKDYWILRVTSTGTKIWDKRYGGTNDEYLESFTKTPDGGFLLAGSSASGQGGDKSQTSKGGKDYWLVKINSKGNKLWDKSFGGSQDDELYSIGITPEKDFFVAGNSSSGQSGDKSQPSQGSSDYWMLKLNSNGRKLWDRTFGGSGTETLRSIIYVQGGYVLAGSSNSNISGDKSQTSQGGKDYWLVKTDEQGNKEYDQRFGGLGNDEFRYIQQTSDGGLLLGGRSDSEASGDRTQPSQGSTDYWLVKVGPDTPANMPLVSARLNIPQEQSGVEMLKLTAYPNPAAGDVTMAFTVSQTQPVTLKIYNNQSQEVATLFQAVAQEGQEYKATWSPKQIAPGMYLLRLQTKDKVHTQKLIVSK